MNTQTEEQKPQLVRLKPFEVAKAELQQLANDYKNLVVTKETYDEAVKARRVLREARLNIEKKIKANKDILNGAKKSLEQEGDELVSIVSPLEETIGAGIKLIDDEKELEKKRKEEEAQKKIAARNASLAGYEMKYVDGTYTLGDHSISAVQIKVFSDAEFEEFVGLVKTEYQKILDLRAEAELARKAEETRLELQRQEQEAERKRLEDLQKEQDRVNKLAADRQEEQRKEIEKQQEALRKEQEEFLRQKRDGRIYQLKEIGLNRNAAGSGYVFEDVFISDDEIDHADLKTWTDTFSKAKVKMQYLKELAAEKEKELQAQAEKEKEEAEKAAIARKESLRPDREKIAAFMSNLKTLQLPEVSSNEAITIVSFIKMSIENIENIVVHHLSEL